MYSCSRERDTPSPYTVHDREEAAMERMTMTIEGMGCGHCVGAVAAALRETAGVTVHNVTVGTAVVDVDPALAGEDDLKRAVEQAGYTPKDVRRE
jgi:copper chaperone